MKVSEPPRMWLIHVNINTIKCEENKRLIITTSFTIIKSLTESLHLAFDSYFYTKEVSNGEVIVMIFW